MNYMHIHCPLLTTEPFLHSSREELGTWLLLNQYCSQQENSGRIRNCRNWAPATWYAVVRSDRPSDTSPIWLWHSDDLVLIGYDVANQKRAQIMRKGGVKGAKNRWNIHPNLPKPEIG